MKKKEEKKRERKARPAQAKQKYQKEKEDIPVSPGGRAHPFIYYVFSFIYFLSISYLIRSNLKRKWKQDERKKRRNKEKK